MNRLGAKLLAGVSMLGLICGVAQAGTIQSAGDLPGGGTGGTARGVSANGLVVVGESSSTANILEAFRWTPEGGMVGLGDLAGGINFSLAEDVSADGLVVVGLSVSAAGQEAFRWTQGSGMVGLGDLAGGGFDSWATGVSADGAVIVGRGESAAGDEAFRWTQAGGMVGLGDLAGGNFYSNARGVSADGAVIVGDSHTASGYEAYRWTQASGMVGLGDLPGGTFGSTAEAVSDDGLVIVGGSNGASGYEAFRWTQATGMVALGDLPGGGFFSTALDVNADGSVVVGASEGAAGSEAFVWTQGYGMRAVADVLIENGVTPAWPLTDARAVSDDGSVIVGFSADSSAARPWIANIDLGIVSVDDLAASLGGAAGVTQAAQRSGAARIDTLLGLATHYGAPRNSGWSAWGGVAQVQYDAAGAESEVLGGHLGLALDIDSAWRIGFGAQWGGGEDTLAAFESVSDSEYLGAGAFVSYQPDDAGLRLHAAVTLTQIENEITRGYLNGATLEFSSGTQEGDALGVALQAGWAFAAGDATLLTPFASYETSRVKLDGYAETGGPFPATFASVEDTLEIARVGVEAEHRFSDAVRAWANLAYAHRFGDALAGASGTVPALQSPFAYSGAPVEENWSEGEAGLEWRGEALRLQASVRTGGELDVGGRLTLVWDF